MTSTVTEVGASRAPVGVFGGTFNPVHLGHLRSALELAEALQLDRLNLMPAAEPPLRETPDCSAAHRLAMVKLAVEDEPLLGWDERELLRAGESYTIDSLIELRRELGDVQPLCMVVGCDAVLNLPQWHRWRELLDWSHLVVIARPGWELPSPGDGGVAQWLERHRVGDSSALHESAAGSVYIEQLRPLPVSSTEIRALLKAGRSPRFLLPDKVMEYIETYELYSS